MTFARRKAERDTIIQAWTAEKGSAPSAFQAQMIHAVSELETGCGQKWRGGPGEGSNNWGGVQALPGQPQFAYSDSTPDNARYAQGFRVYATPVDGARDVVHHMTAPQYPLTGAALETGDVHQVADAMFREHYFGSVCPDALAKYGDAAKASYGFPANGGQHATTEAGMACEAECVARYEAAIRSNAATIASELGEAPPAGGSSWFSRWWWLLALGGAGYYYRDKIRGAFA